MGNDVVDVRGRQPRVGEDLLGKVDHRPDGGLENLVSLHRHAGSARGDPEHLGAFAVGGEPETRGRDVFRARKDHRAGSVAEEDAGFPVGIIGDFRQHVRADDEEVIRLAGGEERVRGGPSVVEPAASRVQVVGEGVPRAEFRLHERRRGGHRRIRGAGRDEDSVEGRGVEGSRFERAAGGCRREFGSRFVRAGEMARLDAGHLPNPLGRKALDRLAGFPLEFAAEFGVRHHAFRERGPGAGDARAGDGHGWTPGFAPAGATAFSRRSAIFASRASCARMSEFRTASLSLRPWAMKT